MTENKIGIALFAIIITVLVCIAVPNAVKPTQDHMARILSGLNPNRRVQVYDKIKDYSSDRLMKYLEHGDFIKQGQAYKRLFERKDEVSFDAVLTLMLETKDQDARHYTQKLLVAINREKGSKALIDELKRFEGDVGERRRILSLLANVNYGPAYPYIEKFAIADSGNKNASSEMLKDFGDPRGIPVLAKRLSDDTELSSFERERVEKALAVLQSEVKGLS